MSKKVITMAISMFMLSVSVLGHAENLNFDTAYLVDGIDGLQPSGMVICQGKLLFVSDKHEDQIYELTPEDDGTATAKKFMELNDIPEPPTQDFPFWTDVKRFFAELFGISGGSDWEGITCNDEGEYFLASEYYFSVLKIGSDGTKKWVGSDLYKIGYDAGLFQKDNAYIEGITVKTNAEILLSAEREPRGFISIATDGDIRTFVQLGSVISDEGLPYDFAGLDLLGGEIFALERNHYQVCRLTLEYAVKKCYSFKNIARSQDWGYSTGKYGLAEGFAINGDDIWIIIDNNGDARLQDSDDHRSTLIKFENPF